MSRRYRPMTTGPRRTHADAVEAALASEDRASFLLGVTQIADLLGRDRGTISAWIDKGCPVARKGGTGEKTLLDPRDVVAWREEFVRDEEARKYARPDGDLSGADGLPMKPADLIKMVDLKIKQLALGQKSEVLVPRHVAEAAFQRCLAVIRETIMSIPEGITRDMAGFPERQKLEWREKALEKCRLALKEGAKAIAAAMPGFEPPVYRDRD